MIEVMGPPDIERHTGLAGAGTYPGGSVIGINGRNAAMEVLQS